MEEVGVGTVVVAPLSGYPQLGIVVGFEEVCDRSLKEIRAVAVGIALPERLVKLCSWAAKAAALPLPAVLRMALPPGLRISTYEVLRPAPNWPWKTGSLVGRTKLYRFLGGEGLKAAERAGRVAFAPTLPVRRSVEWAMAREGVKPELLRRAPRQRTLLEVLTGYDNGCPVSDLLDATGIGREVFRRLVRRGAARLEKRPEPAPVLYTRGSGVGLALYQVAVEQVLSRGRASWAWRTPSAHSAVAAAALVRAAVRRGEQALVLAPEIRDIEGLVRVFERLLPAGITVAQYHSRLGRDRSALYDATRRGEVDVLIGTRAAVLVPMARLGAICVVDEPNEAHRGSPGYEGIPIHVRDLAIARGRTEGATVVFLSPFPSLRLYAPESGVLRLPPRKPTRWPSVAVVDMRGTGATLSSALLNACRRSVRFGERVGVLVNRLGNVVSVSCNRCGFAWMCPACDLLLGLHGTPDGASSLEESFFFCSRCGYRKSVASRCPACGSDRLSGAGLTAERVRAELAGALDVQVGLLAADVKEEGAPIVVGTARRILEREWDLAAIADADSLLFGGAGSVEKGFRLLYGAAEASRDQLLVQTCSPENHVLRAALRGDYETFAATELAKRRALKYPPYAHLAEVTLEGPEEMVRSALESRLRPTLRNGVELLDPVPLAVPPLSEGGNHHVWRALLRGRKRAAVAEAASLVARLALETRGRGKLKARINMDPEEV
jgi:primosomal protein N' (replication factor Y)